MPEAMKHSCMQTVAHTKSKKKPNQNTQMSSCVSFNRIVWFAIYVLNEKKKQNE